MARTPRLVVPELPHHIVQRGTRNQNVFFSDSDRFKYLGFLGEAAAEYGVSFLSWCLMDNHVHLVAIPERQDSFASCFRVAHSRYAYHVNTRNEWSGHLWQYRFGSSPLGPHYLYNAVRYTEQNPVRAGMVDRAWDYYWSSARFHVGVEKHDPLVSMDNRILNEVNDWKEYLSMAPETMIAIKIRDATRKNRPLARQWYISMMKKTRGINLGA
ncbi:MAG: transposase [Candidatus Fermentibacteraceae bacterium]|nr:transposase [Candidatus Fermentibacteraceae bacterium]MBN2608412.1 transposase [Candidatus Fermentibacteraceae bacterium]